MKLDGYVRVSRVGGREGEGYISPDVQREAIEAYAGELGGEIVAWHQDEDYSGGNTERPDFQAALERIRAGESEGIVVKRIDRFARSVPDGSAIVREIVDRGAVFASCDERIDPQTDEGTFMLNSFFNNAELFLNRIKSGWVVARTRAVARGAHIGPTPIGYQRVPKGEARSGCLVPHSVYGPAITALFGTRGLRLDRLRAGPLDVGGSAAKGRAAVAVLGGSPLASKQASTWARSTTATSSMPTPTLPSPTRRPSPRSSGNRALSGAITGPRSCSPEWSAAPVAATR